MLSTQGYVKENQTKGLGYMARFCLLNIVVHLQTHRHETKPNCGHSQGLWHSLNNITPGILSASLLSPFSPFMVILEVPQRRNSRPSRACAWEGDNPTASVRCSESHSQRSACALTKAALQEHLRAGHCLEMVNLRKDRITAIPCNNVFGFLFF